MTGIEAVSFSNLSYKGFRSVTFFLVIFTYVSTTGLLILGYVDAIIWKDTAFAIVGAYVARDAVSKLTEMYWTKRINESNGGVS